MKQQRTTHHKRMTKAVAAAAAATGTGTDTQLSNESSWELLCFRFGGIHRESMYKKRNQLTVVRARPELAVDLLRR